MGYPGNYGDLYEQWKGKQAAMGRRVPDTNAPYYANEREETRDALAAESEMERAHGE